MLNFASDYTESAHPLILKKLTETNLEPKTGYGSDIYCESAREKIRKALQSPEASVWFLSGGTQTNMVVIDSLLTSYQGVLSAETGHIAVHEAGAIEFTGHKVLPLPACEGKMRASDLAAYLERFYGDENHDHMVFPGLVYLTHPTEYGTLYTAAELEEITGTAHRYGIPVYLDGARLGYGLAARGTDVDLPFLARTLDAFYIGGTKVGALMGEAVVFPKGKAPDHFLTTVKQHGGLLAKGWALGMQFDVLFTDGLYEKISAHAIDMAEKLKAALRDRGCTFYLDSPTNQQFIVLEDSVLKELQRNVICSFWEKADETHTVIRLATSWATTEESVDALIRLLPDEKGGRA